MKSLFIDAKWVGDVSFNNEVEQYLKSNSIKSVALFSSVNFLENQPVVNQLENLGIKVELPKAKRTDKPGQVLGCDSYSDSFESDSDLFMYIGDGMFHPEALVFSKEKQVLCWNPVEQKMTIIGYDKIKERKIRMKSNLIKYLNSNIVGILVTVKPGQSFMNSAVFLRKKMKEQNKKVYVFVDDTFNYQKMEDYNFVDVWVNTACPRIGQDDSITMEKPLINIREALYPEEFLKNAN